MMGELARSPDAPKLAETPMELLTLRPGEGFSSFDWTFWPALGFATGFGMSVVSNTLMRRPIWAGVHRHFFIAGLTTYFSIYVRNVKFASRMEDDAVYKHYMCLHPEEFPPFARVRYADVYEPFLPSR